MNQLIAVYGTLRKGESNHQVLGNSEFIKTVRLKGFKMFGANTFPTVIKGTDQDFIIIEVYRLTNPKILIKLDLLEGFDRSNPKSLDNFYTIQKIKIDSETELIEMYTFDHHPEKVHQIGPHLKNGDWCKRNQP